MFSRPLIVASAALLSVPILGGCGEPAGESDNFNAEETGELAHCERVYDGSVYLAYPPDETDVDALGEYDCIDGDLRIWGDLDSGVLCPNGQCDFDQATNSNDLAQLSNLRWVTGSLHVGGTTLTDLEFLSGIEHVGGDLRLQKNPLMVTLDGPSSLETVDGDIHILHNASLHEVRGFDSLASTGGLRFLANGGLADPESPGTIEGFTALEGVYGDLSVEGHSNWLGSLEGLSSVRSVGGNVEIGACYSDYGSLGSLQGLNGLESLEVIEGDFVLACVNGIQSLSALESLHTVDGDFLLLGNQLYGTRSLPVLDLPALESIGGSLVISRYEELTRLDGLERIESVDDLRIDGLLVLHPQEGLDGLSGLTTVRGDLLIWYNAVEQEVAEAFASEIDVAGTVSVEDNGPLP